VRQPSGERRVPRRDTCAAESNPHPYHTTMTTPERRRCRVRSSHCPAQDEVSKETAQGEILGAVQRIARDLVFSVTTLLAAPVCPRGDGLSPREEQQPGKPSLPPTTSTSNPPLLRAAHPRDDVLIVIEAGATLRVIVHSAARQPLMLAPRCRCLPTPEGLPPHQGVGTSPESDRPAEDRTVRAIPRR